MHQCDPVTALRFIEVRSCNDDRELIRNQVGKGVPKLTTGDGVDTGRWLVEQKNFRLRDQRAHERELLLHASAKTAGQPTRKAVHVEHLEVAVAPFLDVLRRDSSQVAYVANVFGNRQVRIKTEGLREISNLRAGIDRSTIEDLNLA